MAGAFCSEPRGGVDGVARHQPLPARHVAGDDLAGVHAGAVLQSNPEPLVEHLVHLDEPLLHLERGPDRAHGVVLVEAGEPEHRHDRVADVLLDPAAVPFQDQPHLVEIQVQHLAEVLAVEAFAESRGALQVREHDGDGSADLFDGRFRGERCAAESAQAEAIRVLLAAIRADLHVRESTPGPRGPGVTPKLRPSDATLRVACGARNVTLTHVPCVATPTRLSTQGAVDSGIVLVAVGQQTGRHGSIVAIEERCGRLVADLEVARGSEPSIELSPELKLIETCFTRVPELTLNSTVSVVST